jgi:hypothetical protein
MLWSMLPELQTKVALYKYHFIWNFILYHPLCTNVKYQSFHACHFVPMSFLQMSFHANVNSCQFHFIPMSFCINVILHQCHSVIISICTNVIAPTEMFARVLLVYYTKTFKLIRFHKIAHCHVIFLMHAVSRKQSSGILKKKECPIVFSPFYC